MEFRLPDLGEGIDSAIVTAVMVKPGDAVAAGQNVIAVETDKASMEIPVESAGTVDAIAVKQGDKIPTGAVILTLGASASASGGREPAVPSATKPTPPVIQPLQSPPPASASEQSAHADRSPKSLPTSGG